MKPVNWSLVVAAGNCMQGCGIVLFLSQDSDRVGFGLILLLMSMIVFLGGLVGWLGCSNNK